MKSFFVLFFKKKGFWNLISLKSLAAFVLNFSSASLQAAAAHTGTDPHGVPKDRDHPHPCAHPGSELPAHEAEPLQQSNHHAVWLAQVRGNLFNPVTHILMEI